MRSAAKPSDNVSEAVTIYSESRSTTPALLSSTSMFEDLTSIKRLRIVMRCVGSRNVRFKKSRYAVWAYVTWDLIEDCDSQCGLT